ncbi:MAG: SLC13 family permease, partial [Planctomycetes bacterium]|nr:SLC13 family permease [Planctomycetota bacterium]
LFLGGLMIVTLCGVIEPQEALAGFANPAVLAIGALFAVAAALRYTGVLNWVGELLLGGAKDERSALRRLTVSLLASSAFLLNTPLVAMMVPVVVDWCRKRGISPSRLLIPVSYLAILGGVCTMIGTSTTLVIVGLLETEQQYRTGLADEAKKTGEDAGAVDRREKFAEKLHPMSLFELGYVGLPCALVGAAFVLFVGPRLLPNRTDLVEQFDDKRREYLVEMVVQPQCRLIGKSIEEAGLRNLPGLYLIEIDRDGDIITPVTPQDELHAGDRLIFTGVVTTIVDLEKIPGLVPAVDQTYELHPQQRSQRHLTEAVLSRTSPLIGTTVRKANFREHYNAAVVAVHRNGVRLTNKIGNIILEPGDTLLLQTRTDFANTYRHSRDFYLVSSVEGSGAVRHDRALIAAALVGLLVVWLSIARLVGLPAGFSSPAVAAIAVAGLMVVTRCLPLSLARSSIDLQVLFTIAAALGLGRALTKSGAAETIADALVRAAGSAQLQLGLPNELQPYVLLVAIYLFAMLATEMITNTAVAAMLFPLAAAVAWSGEYSPRPFVMAITLAASLSFITPIGYQTNLMVMGPGGYRPRDYLRIGLPLAVLIMLVALTLIPIAWPLKM